MTRNQKELLKLLGSEYSMKEIDMENCIYRKINDNYDIEISNTYRKNKPIDVYVWDISKGMTSNARIVESVCNIKSNLQLKNVVDDLAQKYSDL